MKAYDHKRIEGKWQKMWAKKDLYTTKDAVKGRKNFFLLTEFPYPSGNLHVGHWYAFAVPDILARFERMRGRNVMYPIGFDAFGLPAENAAIKNKLNPRKWTYGNIARMQKQIASMGTSFDWSRQVITCDPEYYKWTQWQFLQFYKNGLAYRKNTPANWCSSCKTVLANEQVIDGKCERCGSEVVQKKMMQWNLRITQYADRLHDDLDELEWPEEIKQSQRNWIGRSEGAEIDFPLETGRRYKYVILHGWVTGERIKTLEWYKQELESLGHEVILPELPDARDPKEAEQVASALAATTYDENTILVGHSLGAVVAMKVLERLSGRIAGLVLIAPAVDKTFPGAKRRPFWKHFSWDIDYARIADAAPLRRVISDTQEPERKAYLESLAERIRGELVERTAQKPHFVADKEPDVLAELRPAIRVFTTRADTLFGATYLVLAPEHPWVRLALEQGLIENAEEARAYILLSSKKSDLERQKDAKEKTGVCLRGVTARNPASGESIPVYIADYVLAQYGTGAIMAVPAHDERDFAFARQFDIPIRSVIAKTFVGIGPDVVRSDAESTTRRIVDAIIRDEDGNFYLIREDTAHVHYAGGGVDEGEDALEALRREVIEETGFTDFEIRREIYPSVAYTGFRHTKQKNQSSIGPAYEVVLKSTVRVRSEVEDGRHELVRVRKEDMLETITWGHHRYLFERYLAGDTPFTEEGILHDSGEFSGLESAVAREKMAEAFGMPKKTYRLRDWIVSRQRYWGVPIPIIHCARCGEVPVPEKELPVKLPEVKDYLPEGTGKSPLAKAKHWVSVKCPKCKGKAERETDTFDTFVDSSWYFQRYTDPKNKKAFADKKRMRAWLPVDLYSGGAEHTTMHLLYSRFWHKAMYDLKLVQEDEPYVRRMNRSLIMGPDGAKMSKSKGNVIDPDEVVARLGADTVRMYLAFIGPYNEVSSYPWNPDGVVGVRRFIERVWKLQERLLPKPQEDVERLLHQSMKKLTEDIPQMKFNTAIAQLMMLLNAAEKYGITKKQYQAFLVMLAPFAPHVADELWSIHGGRSSVHTERWPKHDPRKLIAATVTIAVQVNGKTRTQVSLPTEATEAKARAAAESAARQWIGEGTVIRAIYVPQRLVNLVVRFKE